MFTQETFHRDSVIAFPLRASDLKVQSAAKKRVRWP